MWKIECPYCGQDANVENEELNFDEGAENIIECEECKKRFIATTSISIDFHSVECNCLNDSKHSYKLKGVFGPHDVGVCYCTKCHEEFDFDKSLQDESRLEYTVLNGIEYLHKWQEKYQKLHQESFTKWKEAQKDG